MLRFKRQRLYWSFLAWLLGTLVLAACQGEPAGADPTAATSTALPSLATAPPGTAALSGTPATATPLPAQTPYPASRYEDYEIITVLARDAIPAVFDPTFMDADTADDWYEPDEPVIGVVFNGEARAYSVPYLSAHEIVNDEVGGVKIAVTW